MKDTKKISKMIKRTFALALTGSLLLTAVGCGKGSVGGTSAKSKEGTNENYAFKGSEFQVSSADGMLESMTQSDDKVYMLFETFSEVATGTDSGREDAFNGKIATKIVSVPKEGGETEILYESEPSDDGVYTSALSLDKDGTPVVVQSNMGNKGDEFYHICSVKDGKLETLRDVTELFKEAERSSTIILDDKDNLITVADNEFKVYDPNNKEIASQYFGDVWISGFGRSASGDIVVTADDYSDDQEVAKLYVFDKESYEQKKEVKLDTSGISGGGSIMTGDDTYDFFYETSNSIYGYKIEEEKSDKIVDFVSSNIDTMRMGSVLMLDRNSFIAGTYDNMESDSLVDAQCNIRKYTKIDPSELANKTVITYAMLDNDYRAMDAIRAFNDSQTDYKIDIIDYSEENDPEAKLSADIAAGKYADIYQTYYGLGDISLDQAISKGLLEDLSPFIEKDPDISIDDLVPAVKNALVKDGKMYVAAPDFSINTLVAKKSEVGDECAWTYDEFKKYVDSKKDSQLFSSNNKNDILTCLLDGCANDFIDWENGDCHFDSQEFKDILEIANKGTNEEYNGDDDTIDMLANGKILFANSGYLMLHELERMDYVFKGDYTLKGYPSKENAGVHIYLLSDAVGICSKSENKDGAWEFVRTLLTEDYQGKLYADHMYFCPTRQDVFDVCMESMKATQNTTDKYGNEIKPLDDYFMWGDVQIDIKPLTDEQINLYKKGVESASGIYVVDDNVNDIIKEEAAAYFAGDKSVDDVISIIQDRVKTYINENK